MLNGKICLFQMVRAEKMTGFKLMIDDSYPGSFTLLSDNTVAVLGRLTELFSWEVHVYDKQGELQTSQKLPCDCDGETHALLEVTLNSHRYLAISCRERREIWLYSFTTQSFRSVYSDPSKRGPVPGPMCHGPNNTILSVDVTEGSSSVAELHFTSEDTLTLSRLIPVQGDKNDIDAVCYAETTQGPLLFTTHLGEYAICATHLQSGHTQWQDQFQVDGKKCDPRGICHGAGRLYVADGINKRILVLDAATAGFIQSIELSQTLAVWDVAWSDQQPHLVVLQGIDDDSYHIKYYNIEPSQNIISDRPEGVQASNMFHFYSF